MKKFSIYKVLWMGVLGLLLFSAQGAFGQKLSLKTNALLWGNCTPNLSAELVTGKRTTFDGTVYCSLNSTPFDLVVRGVSVEHRYWLAGRPLVRSFVGLGANGTVYRLESSSYRKEGDAGGVGLVYGYVLPLGKHWNIEFVSGFGIYFFREKRYRPEEFDDSKEYNEKGHRFLPTKVGISIAYAF